MSSDQRFILGEFNEARTGQFSDEDHNSLIHLYENQNIEQYTPATLELDALWEYPATKAILIELFFHSLSNDDLHSQFMMRMQNALQEKANITAQQQQRNPQEVLASLMLPLQSSPDASKIMLNQCISRLLSYGLVQREASAVTSKKMYYAITEDGGEPFVHKMLMKDFQESWEFFEVILTCQKIRLQPINRIKIMLRWFDHRNPQINSLLFIFGTQGADGQIKDNPMPLSVVIDQYKDFLITIEEQSPASINNDDLRENILSKLDQLVDHQCIQQDEQNLIHITPIGIQHIIKNNNEVNILINKCEYNYIFPPGTSQQNQLQLTINGQQIIEAILRDVYTNEDRLLKPPSPSHQTGKIGKTAPIYLQMQDYQAMYKNTLQVSIRGNEYYGFRKELVKTLSRKIGPITVIAVLSILSLLGGLLMFSFNMPYSEIVFTISILSFLISMLLLYLRNKWDQPEYIYHHKDKEQYEVLHREQSVFKKIEKQNQKMLEKRNRMRQLMMVRQQQMQKKK